MKSLAVVILNLNRPEFIIPLGRQLLEAADRFRSVGRRLDIHIGDTGSTDPDVLAFFEAHRDSMSVVRDLRYHYSKNNNHVARKTETDGLLFMNNDMSLDPEHDSIGQAFAAVIRNPEALIGANLWYPNGTLQHAGMIFRQQDCRFAGIHELCGQVPPRWVLSGIRRVPAVTGAFLLVSRSLFDRLGGFDEAFHEECQDSDLCLNATSKGHRVLIGDFGRIIHHESATRIREINPEDQERFAGKWRPLLEDTVVKPRLGGGTGSAVVRLRKNVAWALRFGGKSFVWTNVLRRFF